MSQQIWNVVGVASLCLCVFLVLRWRIGRVIRWRRRVMELHTQERALLGLGQVFPRRRRRGSYGPNVSLHDTPFEDGWK